MGRHTHCWAGPWRATHTDHPRTIKHCCRRDDFHLRKGLSASSDQLRRPFLSETISILLLNQSVDVRSHLGPALASMVAVDASIKTTPPIGSALKARRLVAECDD